MGIEQEVVGILVKLEGKSAFIAGVREEQAAIGEYQASLGELSAAQDASAASQARMSSAAALVNKAMLGVTLAVAGGVAESVKAAIEWNDLGKNISQETGLVGKSLDNLMSTIMNTAKQSPYAINEVAAASVLLKQKFGESDSQIEKTGSLLIAFAKRAEGSAKDVGTSVLSILQDFRQPMSQLTPMMDKLTTMAQVTQKPLSEVLGVVEKYGPKLQAMGFSLNDTLKLLGVFQASGITSNMLGRGLSSSLTKATKLSEETGESIPNIIKARMREVMNATSQQEAYAKAVEYFGSQVGPSFARALFNNAGAFHTVEEAMKKQGSTQQLLTAEQGELSGKWQQFKNQLFSYGVEIGQGVVPTLKAVLPLMGVIGWTLMQTTDHGKLVIPVLTALAGAFVIVKGTILGARLAMGLWDIAATVFTAISLATEVSSLADAWFLLDAAFTAAGPGLVILGIAAIAIGIVLLIKHFKQVREAATAAWHWIENGALDVWNWIKAHWVLAMLIAPFAALPIFVATHFDQIKSIVLSVIKWIETAWKNMIHFITSGHIVKSALDAIPVIGSVGHSLGIPGFAEGGIMPYSGLAQINENGPGETVWLPGGATVSPSAAAALLYPRAHSPNPTSLGEGGGRPTFQLKAVLVLPNGQVLAELVTKTLETEDSRL